MEILLFPILSLYFLEHLLFLFGILKNMSRIHSLGEPAIPSVSLIVSAKNEEKIILRCVNSLINIQYPEGQMEILLVNDNSSDRTGEIMKEYSAKSGLKYFEPVGNIDGLKGKTNALAQAIKRTTGEIIFTTDADCIVKSSWIKEIMNEYDDRTGVVCGFSIPQANNLFGGIQAFDWLYLLRVASGAAVLGVQLSCVGNKMSYRRRG